jgi:hypothetical protein
VAFANIIYVFERLLNEEKCRDRVSERERERERERKKEGRKEGTKVKGCGQSGRQVRGLSDKIKILGLN